MTSREKRGKTWREERRGEKEKQERIGPIVAGRTLTFKFSKSLLICCTLTSLKPPTFPSPLSTMLLGIETDAKCFVHSMISALSVNRWKSE